MQDYDYGANDFTYKGFGAIYVLSEEDRLKVWDILQSLDDYEFEHYFNKAALVIIPSVPGKIYLETDVYIGKYDLPKEFKETCIKHKVAAYVYDKTTDNRVLKDIELVLEDTKRKLEADQDLKYKEFMDKIMANREEILEAFVAKYGADPANIVQVSQYIDGKTVFYVTTKDKMGIEN
jgi:hypothetical protein